jgi:hypothetical protein
LNAITPRRPESPFVILVRLFAGRIFHGGGDATDGELDIGLGVVLSLLALPGAFYSLALFEKYSTLLLWMRGQHNFDPLAATVSDEYFFIVLSMFVTGAAAVWRWDSIFPDRRDYANLVPLPIATREIFLANFVAILIFAALLGIVVNAASAFLYPLAVSASQESASYLVQLAGTHALAVFVASIFCFFSIFAIIGLLMVLLPQRPFRRISLYLRTLLFVLLVALLCTSFAVPPLLHHLQDSVVRFLPSVWFLALTEFIHGTATPAMAALGWLSLKVLAIVISIAAITYFLSYRRCFLRIPELADIDLQPTRKYLSWWFALCDRVLLRSPFQRAGYRFLCHTLLRSEHHGLVLSGFIGLGLVIASQVLLGATNGHLLQRGGVPAAALLSLPLIVVYCLMIGLRFVFEVPAELRANWTFQILVDQHSKECLPLARKFALSCVVPWLMGIVFPLSFYLWGWRTAVLQLLVVTLWSDLLTWILFSRLRKVPFTCSYPPFRESALVLALAAVGGFFVFVVALSNLEYFALGNAFVAAALLGIVPFAWYGLSRLNQTNDVDTTLIFEERPTVGFELLDLDQRS